MINQYHSYRGLHSAKPGEIPVTEKTDKKIICLTIYNDLNIDHIKKNCKILK